MNFQTRIRISWQSRVEVTCSMDAQAVIEKSLRFAKNMFFGPPCLVAIRPTDAGQSKKTYSTVVEANFLQVLEYQKVK